VHSTSDALDVHFDGQSNRSVQAHNLNEASSRNHLLFTVTLESKPPGSDARRQGSFTLVGLAGSERLNDLDGAGDASREAVSINTSPFHLGKVVARLVEALAMRNGLATEMPYRES
jgi:hypothetical protein